ncbi:MAG: protein translocase subunit SecD [Bacteroidota bacterium]
MLKEGGFRLIAVVAFLALSIYYLYPTFRASALEGELETLQGEERNDFLDENGATLASLQERALKRGLDLEGGMLVTLEVRMDQLVRELAVDRDETFDNALAEAQRISEEASGDFLETSFVQALEQAFTATDADLRLSRYFRNEEREISRRSSNDEVYAYLNEESTAAIDRAIEIVRDRVDRFGVAEPSIQKKGTRSIVVELPGIDDAERVRRLLRGTARLEVRLMVDPGQMAGSMQQVLGYYESQSTAAAATDSDTLETAVQDGTDQDIAAPDSAVAEAEADSTFDLDALIDDGSSEAQANANPLLQVFQPYPYQGVILGTAFPADTAAARALLFSPETAGMWPSDVTLMWSANPVGTTEAGREVFQALGVRKNVEMTGDVITEATADVDQLEGGPQVSITMNGEGSQTWARLTGANVNKNVAITLDNVVYSFPVVEEKINGGRTRISGLESLNEAKDLVTILKSGALPAPVDIVAEQTVGPSLGAESVRAGTLSTAIGLLLVALFMAFYYRTAGMVADVALLLNIVFIFGILAGFNATLTLPGVAGIVLTIGMAVDANVLVFERVREEQNMGKTLKAAIAGGYGNALSAIMDANITTFLVAAILFSFGSGPIQGFAVTLMAGILSSLFTAIVFARIIMDTMLSRKMSISFG